MANYLDICDDRFHKVVVHKQIKTSNKNSTIVSLLVREKTQKQYRSIFSIHY